MVLGILVPFLGTVMGAAMAFMMPASCGRVNRRLSGFAGGAMLAACIWSLMIPAMEDGFAPAAVGFGIGMAGLSLPDRILERRRGRRMDPKALLLLAVVLHNIPEGMAVGAGYAGVRGAQLADADALTLAAGIAMQNVPDGAVVVLPLMAGGMERRKAFLAGVLSGAVEPLAAVLMGFAPLPGWGLSMLMGFAAGAMMYVIVEELVPGMEGGLGTVWFAAGFLGLLGLDAVM